jgi:hypothetical protein
MDVINRAGGHTSTDVDLSKVFQDADGVSINENHRLGLAKWILLVLALICVGVFGAYAALPDNPALAQIFELVKIGALPLVTLVISFYFPSTAAK